MGKLLDQAGARVDRAEHPFFDLLPEIKGPGYVVYLDLEEKHDDEACACISPREVQLQIGDAVTLTHVCHDGRVDKLTATLKAVRPIVVEHGDFEVTSTGGRHRSKS